jgi:hypothetical protein
MKCDLSIIDVMEGCSWKVLRLPHLKPAAAATSDFKLFEAILFELWLLCIAPYTYNSGNFLYGHSTIVRGCADWRISDRD